jgi:hypothetical protein
MFPRTTSILLLLSLAPAVFASTAVPEPVPLGKYDALIQRSPFAPATAPPAPPAPGFAENLFVNGLARIGSRDIVMVYDQQQATTFTLATGQKNDRGISIASVEWAKKVGNSKVTVRKGDQFAVLQFDTAKLKPSEPQGAPQAAPGQYNPETQQRLQQQTRPSVPRKQQPRGTSRSVPMQPGAGIRSQPADAAVNQPRTRPPGFMSPGPNGVLPTQNAPATPRRRVRIINSAQ